MRFLPLEKYFAATLTVLSLHSIAHVIRLVLVLTLVVSCSGCMKDDVSDLKTMATTEQMGIYKEYYTVGIVDGLMLTGVPYDEALLKAQEVAEVGFSGY